MYEIERRFLVLNTDKLQQHTFIPLYKYPRVQITQHYISFDPVIRIREEAAPYSDNVSYTLTIKGPRTNGKCIEIETPIDEAKYRSLATLSLGSIQKTRYSVDSWSLDIFRGQHQGLQIAEIELIAEDEDLVVPPWCGPEITNTQSLSNAGLARTTKEKK